MSQLINPGAGGGAGGPIDTLTGNTGGAVSPTGSNINVLGGTGIIVVGNPGTSTLTINATGTPTVNYTNVSTSPYIVLTSDYYLSVDCSAMAITLEFPNSALIGQSFVIKDRTGNAAVHNITLRSVNGTINFDGATTYVMNTQYSSVEIMGNSTSYEVF